METTLLYIMFIYLILCLMVAIEGSKRNVGGPIAFILSLVTTPIIGLIVVAFSRRN